MGTALLILEERKLKKHYFMAYCLVKECFDLKFYDKKAIHVNRDRGLSCRDSTCCNWLTIAIQNKFFYT